MSVRQACETKLQSIPFSIKCYFIKKYRPTSDWANLTACRSINYCCSACYWPRSCWAIFDFLRTWFGRHTSAALAVRVLDYFLSQTYDSAPSMPGLFTGIKLRALTEAANSLATYVPCANHSLNLLGNYASNCFSAFRFFFDFVQNLYSFFVARHDVRFAANAVFFLRFLKGCRGGA